MTENEVLEMLLDIKEIQIDGFEVRDQQLHIHCSSIFEEALCPHCLEKRRLLIRHMNDNFEIYLLLEKKSICI